MESIEQERQHLQVATARCLTHLPSQINACTCKEATEGGGASELHAHACPLPVCVTQEVAACIPASQREALSRWHQRGTQQMGIHKIRLSTSTTYTCPPAHPPLHPPMPVWVWVRVQGANSFVCAPKCESMLLVGSAV
jgi:hypothetical protein